MNLLDLKGISKSYGGARALQGAQLSLSAGRIHALLGENGAGKSTIIKIMTGVVQPDEGEMLLDGLPRRFSGPAAANRAGVVCVFQELSLIPDLSVADNITMSRPPTRFGIIDKKAQRAIAVAALIRAGAGDIHPLALVKDLSLSRRQLVEIAKALAANPRVLILDEATSALTAKDVTNIYAVLKRLRSEGLAILYISHRMHEITELADDCTVFCNGRHVETYQAGTKTDKEVVELMLGREFSGIFPTKPDPTSPVGEPLLEVRNLCWNNQLKNISMQLRGGEILGLGGLDGQGQTEFLLALFGVLRKTTGEILVNGTVVDIQSPAVAKSRDVGMALIPEDRKTEGLMLPMTVAQNLTFAALDRISKFGVVNRKTEKNEVDRIVRLLQVKNDGTSVPVSSLSGGNQQKVVLGKWLMLAPRIILLNDPTRGIDVGTKHEIYQLLRKLADSGSAVVLYSTDYDELIGCCDRVKIFYDGAIKVELAGAQITEHALVAAALNIDSTQNQELSLQPATAIIED